MRTTAYRVLGPAWGIAIDLTAESTPAMKPPPDSERITGRLWLDTTPVLNHPHADRSGLRLALDEASWLRQGLCSVAEAVEAALRSGHHTVVTVHRVLFSEADFQPEGLAGAVIAWAQEEFGIPAPPVNVTFDHRSNRFIYRWHENQSGENGTNVRTPRPSRDL
ncbi:hypothetical protein, partial [Streptomyces sp.]|uniref:hypothetical protein n=1 Tax=Streptomyces sp. TaxID=1931 RepID=UPI003D6A09FB